MEKHLTYVGNDSRIQFVLTDQLLGDGRTFAIFESQEDYTFMESILPDYFETLSEFNAPMYVVNNTDFMIALSKRKMKAGASFILVITDWFLETGMYVDETQPVEIDLLPVSNDPEYEDSSEVFASEEEALLKVPNWTYTTCYPKYTIASDVAFRSIGSQVKKITSALGCESMFDDDMQYFGVVIKGIKHSDECWVRTNLTGADIIRNACRKGDNGELWVLMFGEWVIWSDVGKYEDYLKIADVVDAAYKDFISDDLPEHMKNLPEKVSFEYIVDFYRHAYRAEIHSEDYIAKQHIKSFVMRAISKFDWETRVGVPTDVASNLDNWKEGSEGLEDIYSDDTDLLYISEMGEVGASFREEGTKNKVGIEKLPKVIKEMFLCFTPKEEIPNIPNIEIVVYTTDSSKWHELILWSLHIQDDSAKVAEIIYEETNEEEGAVLFDLSDEENSGSSDEDINDNSDSTDDDSYESEDDSGIDYEDIAFEYLESDPENGKDNFEHNNSYYGLPPAEFNNPWVANEIFGEDPRRKDPNINEKDYRCVVISRCGDDSCTLDQTWNIIFKVGSPDIVFVLYSCD